MPLRAYIARKRGYPDKCICGERLFMRRSFKTNFEEIAMMLGLRTAIYTAPDLAKAKDWYSQVFECKPYFDQPFYVGFEVGGFELGLMPSSPEHMPSTHGAEALWGVPNADEAYARLLGLGATALSAVADVGEGIKVAAVKDPFGNRLGIIENPNFDLKKVR
jgi:predicted enzyme related to lactoylglutathione lyase